MLFVISCMPITVTLVEVHIMGALQNTEAVVADQIQSSSVSAILQASLSDQRAAYFDKPTPDYAQRKSDLLALKALLSENLDDIVEAINADYGNRSKHETIFAEVISVTDCINDTIKHLKKWMKVQRRHVDKTMFFGAKNRVIPQPLGVVGLIIPWNFPVNLSFSQLCAAFAAGNRAMVKMSENSRALSRVLMELSPKYFAKEKLEFFEETGGVGIEFSKLPFDLLIFTGSGQTGRKVMAAAADNLTPVILELGGKAPAVIDPDYSLSKAVDRIMYVKQFNAGQICTNVDYVFVHETQIEEFVTLAQAYVAQHCPDVNSQDYTAIIDSPSMQRLMQTLDDAKNKGARVVNLSGAQEANAEQRKLPLHIVLDTTDDMIIRQRETFGPLLMVLAYRDPKEVVSYVNAGSRPLAFYPFSNDDKLVDMYIDRIMSGGVTVNDALFHVAQHDIPFGGIGESGMGHYHGYEGFVACSKMRPVFYQANTNFMKYMSPPYGKFADRVLKVLVKMKG